MEGVREAQECAATLVRGARLRAGLSQAELARRSGVARPVVWAIEHGQRQPSLPTLAKVLAGAGARLRVAAVPAPTDGTDAGTAPAGEAARRHSREVRDVLELADALRRSAELERRRGAGGTTGASR